MYRNLPINRHLTGKSLALPAIDRSDSGLGCSNHFSRGWSSLALSTLQLSQVWISLKEGGAGLADVWWRTVCVQVCTYVYLYPDQRDNIDLLRMKRDLLEVPIVYCQLPPSLSLSRCYAYMVRSGVSTPFQETATSKRGNSSILSKRRVYEHTDVNVTYGPSGIGAYISA